MRIWIQGFDQDSEIIQVKKKHIFLQKLQHIYPWTSVQATGEAFEKEHPQQSTALQNNKISSLFLFFVGHFYPPGSGSGFIRPKTCDPYPDPQC
jgi:hypothetical protein